MPLQRTHETVSNNLGNLKDYMSCFVCSFYFPGSKINFQLFISLLDLVKTLTQYHQLVTALNLFDVSFQ